MENVRTYQKKWQIMIKHIEIYYLCPYGIRKLWGECPSWILPYYFDLPFEDGADYNGTEQIVRWPRNQEGPQDLCPYLPAGNEFLCIMV